MRTSFKELFALISLLVLMLLTGCNADDSLPTTAPKIAKLSRIDITASPTTQGSSLLTLAKGNKQPFRAMGLYTDGSSRELANLSVIHWNSSDRGVGFFDTPGVLTGGTPGLVLVSVTKGGITSNTVKVNVTAAVITGITVTPSIVNIAKGQTQQLTATATYSDSTSYNVTSSVTWTAQDATATVTPKSGVLLGVAVGAAPLSATKDGITSNTVKVNVTTAVVTSIAVTPSPVNVAKGQSQQLTATATYSDNTTSNVTSSVAWATLDTTKATVTSAGLLSGVKVGSTTLTAIKDHIASNKVAVNVCANLAGTCIDIFDAGSGKLFTSSPSKAYLDSIGGSTNDGTNTEPVGDFNIFNWKNANALCTTYNTKSIGGRTNWRLATKNELKTKSNLFTARGWPVSISNSYWSATPDSSDPGSYYVVIINFGGVVGSGSPVHLGYASCVSEP